jgi:hypothetical protein
MRIAMWSGPRNLSTAMMYAFGNRGDCAVVDEPFYAAYLALTGLQHPMREDILESQSQDANEVAEALVGPVPAAKPYFYQKHMTQHMIDGVPRDWMRQVTNVFLIRHPARVIASYAAKRENPVLDDIGFRQQAELFDLCRSWGQKPVVVDMLSWPKGGHPGDGVWAPVWYGAVWNSSGFAGAEGALPKVPDDLRPVLEAAMPYYEAMKAQKI